MMKTPICNICKNNHNVTCVSIVAYLFVCKIHNIFIETYPSDHKCEHFECYNTAYVYDGKYYLCENHHEHYLSSGRI